MIHDTLIVWQSTTVKMYKILPGFQLYNRLYNLTLTHPYRPGAITIFPRLHSIFYAQLRSAFQTLLSVFSGAHNCCAMRLHPSVTMQNAYLCSKQANSFSGRHECPLVLVVQQVGELCRRYWPQCCPTALTWDVLVWATFLVKFADQTWTDCLTQHLKTTITY